MKFPFSYDEARQDFLQLSEAYKTMAPETQIGAMTVPSQIDDNLTIDHTYIPAKSQKNSLLIISSGVHGIESFAGSAIQQSLLENLLPRMDRSQIGVYLLHSLNPYGFKYRRRVTENNVDLNRNFVDFSQGKLAASSNYAKIDNLLNPQSPAVKSAFSDVMAFFQWLKVLLNTPVKQLRQTILSGQHQYAKGVFFAGHRPEIHRQLLEGDLRTKIQGYENIIAIDLHTGYGRRGHQHLLCPGGLSKPSREASQNLFSGHSIDRPDDKDFYQVQGSFLSYLGQLCREKLFVPITLEYGTADNHKLWGAIKSLQSTLLENQGFHYGYSSDRSKCRIEEAFLDLYNPSDSRWQNLVLNQAIDTLTTITHRLTRAPFIQKK